MAKSQIIFRSPFSWDGKQKPDRTSGGSIFNNGLRPVEEIIVPHLNHGFVAKYLSEIPRNYAKSWHLGEKIQWMASLVVVGEEEEFRPCLFILC